MNIRRTVAVLTSAAALTVTGVAMAPANAAPNNANQEGLVNLALQDTTVQLPIALAANVCGVAVNLLASATASGPVDCTAEGVATAERERGGPNNARQNGLVNVAVQDTTVQVPIAVAANVCGVTVNAISALNLVGPTTCDALAEAGAQG
jgi:hypothetical protein